MSSSSQSLSHTPRGNIVQELQSISDMPSSSQSLSHTPRGNIVQELQSISDMSSSSQSLSHTPRGNIVQELQKIWDEIGESDNEKEKMLLELEQECLDIYQRKVEYTRKHKADLYEALAEGVSEIARLSAALGVSTSFSQANGTLKEQLSSVKLALDDLRLKKQQRVQDFSETELQIIRICAEIAGNDQVINNAEPQVNEDDLTTSRLSERKSHLEELQNEKVLRLKKVHDHISSIHELSAVMSLDFAPIVAEIHSSLVDTGHGQSKSICNDTLAKLTSVVDSLKQEKQQRLQKIQELGSALVELWNLLDTSMVDRNKFEDVTGYIRASVDEVSWRGALSQDVIEQAENEVAQLNILKDSKMSSDEVHIALGKRRRSEPKLVTIYKEEEEEEERLKKMGEVDINNSYGYYTFAFDIQSLCQELYDEEPPTPHICSPWFPYYGVTHYYSRTGQGGNKLINPLMTSWKKFSEELDYVVVLPLDTNLINIEVVDSADEVKQKLPIFKKLITDSEQLVRVIYFYYCSEVNTEPKLAGKEPDLLWEDADCSYIDENGEKMKVELCDDGVLGMSEDDFLRKLTRICIKEAWL